jgi:hypothetical protein
MLVNEATVEDAVGIAHVNVSSWRHTYADRLPFARLSREISTIAAWSLVLGFTVLLQQQSS